MYSGDPVYKAGRFAIRLLPGPDDHAVVKFYDTKYQEQWIGDSHLKGKFVGQVFYLEEILLHGDKPLSFTKTGESMPGYTIPFHEMKRIQGWLQIVMAQCLAMKRIEGQDE